MILSDFDIIREHSRLVEKDETHPYLVKPFDHTLVGPCSIDMRLDTEIIRGDEEWSIEDWDLMPGDFILASTLEKVNIPAHLCAQVSGKSSMMRKGIQVCNDAGYIDAGFRGKITLEVANHGHYPVRLTPGMKICQLVLTRLTSPALRPYGHEGLDSHYQDQQTVTRSALLWSPAASTT